MTKAKQTFIILEKTALSTQTLRQASEKARKAAIKHLTHSKLKPDKVGKADKAYYAEMRRGNVQLALALKRIKQYSRFTTKARASGPLQF